MEGNMPGEKDLKGWRWDHILLCVSLRILNTYDFQLRPDDGSEYPPTLAKLHAAGSFGGRKAMLEVDDSLAFMLDLIIITFVYMEKKKRDSEIIGAAADAVGAASGS